jgi:hypothetical protein
MAWGAAETYAEQRGGTLAAIQDAQENAWLANTFVSTGDEYFVWVGGRDLGTGHWSWATGEPFQFTNWFMNPSPAAAESFIGFTVFGPERGSWTSTAGVEYSFFGLIELPTLCYPNCDRSTVAPFLNVGDFVCFLDQFASGAAYANCDGSTAAPYLNVSDFTCYLQRFAASCSSP